AFDFDLPSFCGGDSLKKKIRIAVATNGKDGLEDTVSEVFGRANTFTILDIEDGEVKLFRIIENPALSYKHGAGPIVIKELVDFKVDSIVGPQLGHGASSILEHHSKDIYLAKGGTKVTKAIEDTLKEVHKK
ncbi:MAG: NifB/NifX family molybdenum-iron cluster-binding protein, partial [Candidatus Hermodarchaeota archaeon]